MRSSAGGSFLTEHDHVEVGGNMSHPDTSPVARRGFLFRLSQAAAAVTAIVANPARLQSASLTLEGKDDPDAWMARLRGQHKVMIHVHQYFMTALVDARNMLANARDFYGMPESQHSIAVITHGPAIQGLFRDDVWQKLALGEFYKVTDPKTGAPAVRNIYLTPQEGEPQDAAVNDLMRRGVTFVVCNVAVINLAKRLGRPGVTPDALHDELAAGLVPGAFLVPDVFVSMERAQRRGLTYVFTDRSR
jgi:intracellular sulfur oxidation DsrE/DsrF family protein